MSAPKHPRQGILGGSFNPVHVGHVALARKIQELLHFDPLWIIPSHKPPHKAPYLTDDQHRLEMVHRAFDEIEGTKVSTFELDRPETSYAIETIRHLARGIDPRSLFFILGADAFFDLPEWYRFPEVMESCSYIAVSRAGWTAAKGHGVADRLADLVTRGLLTQLPAATPFRASYATRSGTTVNQLELELPEVSSSEVRQRLENGLDISELVPPKVALYLKSTGLYGSRKP